MNIKFLDSWLREYLKTKATPKQIADSLSLTSVSVEKVENFGNDFVYDTEITTNRVDLASTQGLAREAAAVLSQFTIDSQFEKPTFSPPKIRSPQISFHIKNDPKLVNRICAVVLRVKKKDSPAWLKNRLEAVGIRSLNNLVDITNYVMRDVGHPTHVFDFDRLDSDTLLIRESKKGEKIITLDKKEHTLQGGDIVAENGEGEIVDLLGVMGLENSVVSDQTKRILFFIDNNDAYRIRKTSMSIGIRTEAAMLNERGVDPNLAMDALLKGLTLYQELADAQMLSDIIDIYPQKPQKKEIIVPQENIKNVIGIDISLQQASRFLEKLGFKTTIKGDLLEVIVPSFREKDIDQDVDIIEEIARVYGYHNLPSRLPPVNQIAYYRIAENPFFWESRIKQALKYFGFSEVYTYSFVSEELYEGPTENAITVENPLNSELLYLRRTLTPSLLQVLKENSTRENMRIFEIANAYEKNDSKLPLERLKLAGVLKEKNISFFKVKGILEQLASDLGIKQLKFQKQDEGGIGAKLFAGYDYLGDIEMLEEDVIDFELDFESLIKHATLKKTFTPLSKYPPVIEDLALIIDKSHPTGHIIEEIQKQDSLITSVTLLDEYQKTRTFHILYQKRDRNVTTDEVSKIREKIISNLKKKYGASIKI